IAVVLDVRDAALRALGLIETVHLPAVDHLDTGQERVLGTRGVVVSLGERDGRSVAEFARRSAVGAGVQPEERVEGAVLFDQEHDLGDLLARQPQLLRVIRERLPARRLRRWRAGRSDGGRGW